MTLISTPVSLREGRGREQMNVVILGHVDHGKSTVVGRLIADTGSLPEGKLEQVRRTCQANAKPFEYAFLLDALKDEQSQGITIDTARCFFKTALRDYVIIDAPGHVEFLKNMVTGASRAEAALLVIDAKEGIQENSRRHGFMASMLGIRQLVVLVNKMDLVGWDQGVFRRVEAEYSAFLAEIAVRPEAFVPISALGGDNLASASEHLRWYPGLTVLQTIDRFEKQRPAEHQPFRMPVQAVYKFTESGDARRIVAGTVVAGSAQVGQTLVFHPSGKRTRLKSVEGFAEPARTSIGLGEATGVTLEQQVYVTPGEIACVEGEAPPEVGSFLRASVFWLGRKPLVQGKRYKLKLATAATTAFLRQVSRVVDASELSSTTTRSHVERHEVADCVFETVRPIAYDLAATQLDTGRFVIVDDYEIAGGGILLANPGEMRSLFDHSESEANAAPSARVSRGERLARLRQQPKLVVLTGPDRSSIEHIAARLERELFASGRFVYFVAPEQLRSGLEADLLAQPDVRRDEHLRRLGELARLFADAGCVLIAATESLDTAEARQLRRIAAPSEVLLVGLGDERIDEAELALSMERAEDPVAATRRIHGLLVEQRVLQDYEI